MAALLTFAGDHPFLTFALVGMVCSAVVQVARAIRGIPEPKDHDE